MWKYDNQNYYRVDDKTGKIIPTSRKKAVSPSGLPAVNQLAALKQQSNDKDKEILSSRNENNLLNKKTDGTEIF